MASSSLSETVRYRVLERDGYTCQNCGDQLQSSSLDVHHRTPSSKGGSDDRGNLVTLCRPCHASHHQFERSEFAAALTAVLQEYPVVTSRDLAERLDCSRETARQWLVAMWEEGKIERRKVGGRAKVYYPKYREGPDDDSR